MGLAGCTDDSLSPAFLGLDYNVAVRARAETQLRVAPHVVRKGILLVLFPQSGPLQQGQHKILRGKDLTVVAHAFYPCNKVIVQTIQALCKEIVPFSEYQLPLLNHSSTWQWWHFFFFFFLANPVQIWITLPVDIPCVIWTSKCLLQQSLQKVWPQDKWLALSKDMGARQTGQVISPSPCWVLGEGWGGDGGLICAAVRRRLQSWR